MISEGVALLWVLTNERSLFAPAEINTPDPTPSYLEICPRQIHLDYVGDGVFRVLPCVFFFFFLV